MKRINLLIAALHASALAAAPFALGGVAVAQSNDEVRAYMEALSSGTAELMNRFLLAFPNSTLPGSELGASIAGQLDHPTASTGPAANTQRDHGWRSNDDHGNDGTGLRSAETSPGIY